MLITVEEYYKEFKNSYTILDAIGENNTIVNTAVFNIVFDILSKSVYVGEFAIGP